MGIFKSKPKRSKKHLCINIDKEINDFVVQYCTASGVNLQDVGFAIGRICKDEDLTYQLSYIMSIYFKAGIYYTKEEKDPGFWYKYLTQDQMEKLKEKIEDKEQEILDDIKKTDPSEKKANYIG